jgi:curli biogenesis system outer membrane secretion channel CsgG
MFIWNKQVRQFNIRKLIFITMLYAFLAACTTVIEKSGRSNLESQKSWILLPFQNYSGTPRAGEKIEEILATLLRSKGIDNLQVYQNQNEKAENWPILDEKGFQNNALFWARQHKFDYGVTGNIEEWQYKSSVGGEPAVGLSLRVIEIASGRVVWSTTGAKSGWSAETVSGTAQGLVDEMLARLDIK